MSEQADDDSKTEEATEKRIQDALDKGNVPFSKEAPVLTSMLGMLVFLTCMDTARLPRLASIPAGETTRGVITPNW